MPSLILTWHTAADERVCPICRPLNGHTWTFDTSKDAFPLSLRANGRLVWNCQTDRPRPHHGYATFNCRCKLSSRFDFSDMKASLLDMVGEVEEWNNGLHLVARRESGQFITWRPGV
jgi:hypothetical protein